MVYIYYLMVNEMLQQDLWCHTYEKLSHETSIHISRFCYNINVKINIEFINIFLLCKGLLSKIDLDQLDYSEAKLNVFHWVLCQLLLHLI